MLGCASIQAQKANRRLGLPGVLALILLAISTPDLASQLPHRGNTRQTAKAISPLQQAEELIQQGSFEQARAIIGEQLARNPADVDAYNLLGIVDTDEKDYDHALEAFQHALNLASNSTKTRNNLGNLYVAQQKFDLAEQEFTRVLSVAPANRDANYNLGLVLLAKGAPLAAIQHLQRVHPLSVETRFNLVRAYLQAGKTGEALTAARELSAAHKQNVQLHFTLGVLLAAAKQYKSAQLELEQANALKPETFEILYNLGQAYLRGHEYAKAELALNRGSEVETRLRRDSVSAGAGLFGSRRGRLMLSIFWCALTSWRRRTGCDLFDGPCQHDPELFRRRDSAARIRFEDCATTG